MGYKKRSSALIGSVYRSTTQEQVHVSFYRAVWSSQVSAVSQQVSEVPITRILNVENCKDFGVVVLEFYFVGLMRWSYDVSDM